MMQSGPATNRENATHNKLTRGLPLLLGLAAIIIVEGLRHTSSFIAPIALAGTVAPAFSIANVLSVIFWAFVLGPVDAVLAIPLMIYVKAILIDSDPGARWMNPILEGDYGRDHDDAESAPPTEAQTAAT